MIDNVVCKAIISDLNLRLPTNCVNCVNQYNMSERYMLKLLVPQYP